MTCLREIGTWFIMIIHHLIYQLLQNLCLTSDLAFPPPSSWRGNTFILATISLSVGLKGSNLFLTRLPSSCRQESCIDGFLSLYQWLKIKFTSLWGRWGNSETPKRTTKIQNVIKSRAPGWKWICTSTGKAKRGRSGEARCSPRLPTWPSSARGSVH